MRWWVHQIPSMASGAEDYHLFELVLASGERVTASDHHDDELRNRGVLRPAAISLGTASSSLLWMFWWMFAGVGAVVVLLIWRAGGG